jgi:hypothetical protein
MFVPSVSWQNDHFYTKSGQKVPFSHVVDEVADLLWLEEMIQRELSDAHTDGIRQRTHCRRSGPSTVFCCHVAMVYAETV